MTSNPDTLRLYASIFEKPRRGALYEPTMIDQEAARALRFLADTIERNAPAFTVKEKVE